METQSADCGHVLILSGIPRDMRSLSGLEEWIASSCDGVFGVTRDGVSVRWHDDSTAVAIFGNSKIAEEAMAILRKHPAIRVSVCNDKFRRVHEATASLRLPGPSRPMTDARVANRLIRHALGPQRHLVGGVGNKAAPLASDSQAAYLRPAPGVPDRTNRNWRNEGSGDRGYHGHDDRGEQRQQEPAAPQIRGRGSGSARGGAFAGSGGGSGGSGRHAHDDGEDGYAMDDREEPRGSDRFRERGNDRERGGGFGGGRGGRGGMSSGGGGGGGARRPQREHKGPHPAEALMQAEDDWPSLPAHAPAPVSAVVTSSFPASALAAAEFVPSNFLSAPEFVPQSAQQHTGDSAAAASGRAARDRGRDDDANKLLSALAGRMGRRV